MNKKRVLARAPALSQSGYGCQARFALKSLKYFEDQIDLYLINVGWGATGMISFTDPDRKWIDDLIIKTHLYINQCKQQNQNPQFDISLQVTIPNEIEKLAPVNVLYTAGIETDHISPVWVQKSFEVDRIIVVSNHAKFGFDNTIIQGQNIQTKEIVNVKCDRPIFVVNYPVGEIYKDKDLSELNLDLKYDFNYLVVNQWSPRKNLENTIKWFVEEFKNDEVGLILKVSTRNNSTTDRFQTQKAIKNLLLNYPNRKCEIVLLHGDMSEKELTSLYRHDKVKALISISHGEGYCLPLFESAYNALPVICPTWGGQNDFIFAPVKNTKGKIKNKALVAKVDYDIAPVQPHAVWKGVIEPNTNWSYVKENSYKNKLREVYKNYGFFKSQAKKLRKYIIENFVQEEQYRLFAEAVLGEMLVVCKKEDLPKVSFYTSVFKGGDLIKSFMKDVTSQKSFKEKGELVLIHPKNSPDFEKESKVIGSYLKDYDNIVYKVLDDDPGLYECWNIGAKECSGEYIGNWNLDDRRSKDYLERFAKELFLNSNIDLVYSDALITDKFNETFDENSSNGRKYNFPEFSFDNLKMVNMPHAAPLYRKSLHDKYGYFKKQYKFAADWEFHLHCASNDVKMKKISGLYYLYCFSPTGVTTNPSRFPEKMIEEKEVFEKYKYKEIEK